MLIFVALIVVGLMWLGSDGDEQLVLRADPVVFGRDTDCESPDLVRDFGLSRMPATHEVPEFGKLPFAPKTMGLLRRGGRVLPPGESFGYGLIDRSLSGNTPLHWTVRARLSVADSSGTVGREIDSLERDVPRAGNGASFYLDPLDRAGFYLYEIEFLDQRGEVLGAYSVYFRVFEKRYWKARLSLNAERFQPGSRVWGRVENLGTERVYYGESFLLERWADDSWVSAQDVFGANFGFALWLGNIEPGAHGECNSLELPSDVDPGRYRLVKEVGPAPWPNGDRRYLLTAPFIVAD
ncbi:MAG: immunoglobulin-like domain-containing protein [Solirubrobacterales bacterium]